MKILMLNMNNLILIQLSVQSLQCFSIKLSIQLSQTFKQMKIIDNWELSQKIIVTLIDHLLIKVMLYHLIMILMMIIILIKQMKT